MPAGEILTECNRGMIELGNRFADGNCFLPELMFGGMMMKAVMTQLGPHLGAAPEKQTVGTVVIGSVQHDVHDIGKDIVVMMLRGVGMKVVDLGVDVPPAKFVAAIREHNPQVVGMSVLLTTCFKSVAATVEAIRQSGLRDGLKIMVGGAAASQLMAESTGCDYYGKTAVDGVHYAGRLVAAA
jgi:methylmalonyl-CoA mutase cobalamin-binding domain/chain